MRFLFDTITGRTILVLVLGLGGSLLLAQYLYQVTSERELRAANADRIADRLFVLAETIKSVPADERDATAHRLSGGPLELHWSETPLATPGGDLDASADRLRSTLLRRAPELEKSGLVFGTSRSIQNQHGETKPADAHHVTLISMALQDGSWLNVTLAQVTQARLTSPSVLISTAIGAIGVLLVAILIGRWLTRPLSRLAKGARAAFIEGHPSQLPEVGTREVRTLATAMNDMHGRIQRMMSERTQMLAAISHDLRTPLTRMRLRTNGTPDQTDLAAVNRDLDEMEAMIEATLDFLREDAASEQTEPVDLSTILQTIADDAHDEGRTVELDVPHGLVVEGRHLALKRAFSNLIENALKYGGVAKVQASQIPSACEIFIRDQGPGISEEYLERVFEPFYRVDQARQRVKGGYGLGLTAARSIIRKHGGEISIGNRAHGGLEVRVTLPVDDQTT